MSDKFNRIFCIGRNYVKHVEELNNEFPPSPVVFMKPVSCLVPVGKNIAYPSHGSDLQHELELVLLIDKKGKALAETDAMAFIGAYTLGLDLTLRDVQQKLKEKGLPWEKAKAFECSAPLGEFKPYHDGVNLNDFHFELRVNGKTRQRGYTGLMIFPIKKLIVELSRIWTLLPGDIIYTGTPEGVAALSAGDEVEIFGNDIGPFSWKIN